MIQLKVRGELKLQCVLTPSIKAQEEMAWQIAKMIVNDVVHQSNHDSPGKATKVQNFFSFLCSDMWSDCSSSLSVFFCLCAVMTPLRNQRTRHSLLTLAHASDKLYTGFTPQRTALL